MDSGDSATSLWGGADVVGFGSLACSLTWLHQACYGVSSAIRETPLWLCVHAGSSTRQKICYNVQPTTDTRTSKGRLAAITSVPSQPVSSLAAVICLFSTESPFPQFNLALLLLPFSGMWGIIHLWLFLCVHLPLGVFPTVLLCSLQKLLLRHWLAEGFILLIWIFIYSHNIHLILAMPAEKKGFKLRKTGTSKIQEEKEKLPCSSQSLGR